MLRFNTLDTNGGRPATSPGQSRPSASVARPPSGASDEVLEPVRADGFNHSPVFTPLGALLPRPSVERDRPIPLTTLPPITTSPEEASQGALPYLYSARNPGVLLKDPVLLANGDTIERSELREGEVHGDNHLLRSAIESRQAMLAKAAGGAPVDNLWRTDVVDIFSIEAFVQPVQILSKVVETRFDETTRKRVPTGASLDETHVYEASMLQEWVSRKGTSPMTSFPLVNPFVVAPNFAIQALCADKAVSDGERAALVQASKKIVLPRGHAATIRRLAHVQTVQVPLTAAQQFNIRARALVAGGFTTVAFGGGGALIAGAMTDGNYGAEIGGAILGAIFGVAALGYSWRHVVNRGPVGRVPVTAAPQAPNTTPAETPALVEVPAAPRAPADVADMV